MTHDDERRGSTLQTAAVAVAVVGVLPYITLKAIWLTGGTLGVLDRAVVEDGGFFGLNLLTFAMDLVALLIALALVRPWGRRIPAGLILFPMWVGTGLLVPLSVQAPLAALAGLLGGEPIAAGSLVEGWVYLVVYTGFVCQGAGLTVAFAHHARRRWPEAFAAPAEGGPVVGDSPGPVRELQGFLARGAAVAGAIVAAFDLSWALGSAFGLPAEVAARRAFPFHLQNGVNGLMAITAVAGLLVLVTRRPAGRPWVPVVAVWLGSGAMFGWSLWEMLVALTPSGLASLAPSDPGALRLVALFALLTGLAAGITGAFALAGRIGSRAAALPGEAGTAAPAQRDPGRVERSWAGWSRTGGPRRAGN